MPMKINLITEEASLLKGAAALAGHDILLTGAEEADLQVTAEGCSEGLCVEMPGSAIPGGWNFSAGFLCCWRLLAKDRPNGKQRNGRCSPPMAI